GSTYDLAGKVTKSIGSSFWNVDASSPSTTPVIEKIDKIEKLIIEGKVTLVDDDGNPLEKVASSCDYDREDEVAYVDNDMANFLVKRMAMVSYDMANFPKTYDKVDGSIIFGLHHKIHTLKQNRSSIADYYNKLNAIWKQYDDVIELPKCVFNASNSFKKHNQLMKLMQFLMGLYDSYMQIRSSIICREVLPHVKSVYATISSEDSYRVSYGSIAGSSQRNQASAFVTNVPNRGVVQRVQSYSTAIRHNNFNYNKQDGGFTHEQMETLIFLIKDNKNGMNVMANMACVHDWHCTLALPAELVLSVLKGSLQINNMDKKFYSETCQIAKQTKEPFPLIDHVSKSLGDVVHLDL
ncbi:hypothetical protein Tco_1141170, partial [Tanacetum coccineum]